MVKIEFQKKYSTENLFSRMQGYYEVSTGFDFLPRRLKFSFNFPS